MTRLPTLHSSKVVKALLKAGFVQVNQRGSHLTLWKEETKRQTTVPMHGRDIGRGLLKAILKQAGLNEKTFLELL